MTTRCPTCGADEILINCTTTLLYGGPNTTAYRCSACGCSWKDEDCLTAMISPIEYEIQSQYGVLKDWLVENYAERPDVQTVYEALLNLLTKLDENALSRLR
jgi:hypothetical protein